MNRYKVTSSEGELQPGAEPGVLKNRLGLTHKQDVADAETELLVELSQEVLTQQWPALNFQQIKHWHHRWLGNLYDWAGALRTVYMGKGGFQFAAPTQFPKLITAFEDDFLKPYALLPDMADAKVVTFLAASHVEFILLHPFREGNGRISRLLLNVMAIKAGFEPLDYQLWETNRDFYFKSIQAGVGKDYSHMALLVRDVLLQQG